MLTTACIHFMYCLSTIICLVYRIDLSKYLQNKIFPAMRHLSLDLYFIGISPF